MTLQQLILRWNKNWRYDYWWRQKYQVSFNSERHREISQIDVAFEFNENYLANQAYEKHQQDEQKQKHYKETGQWMKVRIDNKRQDELFDKLKLDSFN